MRQYFDEVLLIDSAACLQGSLNVGGGVFPLFSPGKYPAADNGAGTLAGGSLGNHLNIQAMLPGGNGSPEPCCPASDDQYVTC